MHFKKHPSGVIAGSVVIKSYVHLLSPRLCPVPSTNHDTHVLVSVPFYEKQHAMNDMLISLSVSLWVYVGDFVYLCVFACGTVCLYMWQYECIQDPNVKETVKVYVYKR